MKISFILLPFYSILIVLCIISPSLAGGHTDLTDASRLSEFGLMDLFRENTDIKSKRSTRKMIDSISGYHKVKASTESDSFLDKKLELEEDSLLDALSTGFSMSYYYNEPKTATPSRKLTSPPAYKGQPIQTKSPTMKPSNINYRNSPTAHPSKKVEPMPSSSSLSSQPKEIHLTSSPMMNPSKAPTEPPKKSIYLTSRPSNTIPSETQVTNSIMLCSGNGHNSSISPEFLNVVETYTYLYTMETSAIPSQSLLNRIDSTVKSTVVAKLCKNGSLRRNHRFLSLVGVNGTTSVTILQSPKCSSRSVNSQCNVVQAQVETIQRANESFISSEQMMNQIRSVMEVMNTSLVKDGSVISISFVGASWYTSPPSTSSGTDAGSISSKTNDSAAIGVGVAAFMILILGTLASILHSRKKPSRSEQKFNDSPAEIDQAPTFEDESTCSSGFTPQSSSITSMTFTKGTATVLDAHVSVRFENNETAHGQVGNRILLLSDAGYDAETIVNEKSFADGDIVQELNEF